MIIYFSLFVAERTNGSAAATCANYDICSDIRDCGDTCDELRALCREIMPIETDNCVLPPYPANGTYRVSGELTQPGLLYKTAELELECSPGYVPNRTETPTVSCRRGKWLGDFPNCIWKEEISPTFNFTSDCGQLTASVNELIVGDSNAERIPWHAIIYLTTTIPHLQICGGSVITTTAVISAAHCFWKDKKQPASNYAVAVGKLYRPWNHPNDKDAQKFEVGDIRIPETFVGAATNFQDDIAILILKTAIRYGTFVQPVCLDFDYNLENQQLQLGKIGKIAGWLSTTTTPMVSPTIKVQSLPYLDINTCLDNSPPSFRPFLTSDKMCAGDVNGTGLCRGSGGNGLTFAYEENGVVRYYLRGVVCTAPAVPNDSSGGCGSPITGLTQIIKHENFIKKFAK